jgi:hypothetical protein
MVFCIFGLFDSANTGAYYLGMNTEMSADELKVLTEKVKKGTATSEEELVLLKFLNKGVEEMRSFIKEVMEK